MRDLIYVGYLLVTGAILWGYYSLPEESPLSRSWAWRLDKHRVRDPFLALLAVTVVFGIALGLLTSEHLD